MARTQNSKIQTIDYNEIRNEMLLLLGTGSGDKGYGQTSFNSSSVSTGQKIKESDWDNLRADIFRIADHQGTSISLSNVTTTTKLSAATAQAYYNILTGTLTTNRFNITASQYSDEFLTSSTRTINWNSTISHYFNINFGSYDNARFFFNAGGQIRINPSFTKSNSLPINNDWETLINGVGTVVFAYTNTTVGGTEVSSIGFYDLTGSNQQIYTRTGGTANATYAVNDYTIRTRISGGIVYFECEFKDDKTTVDPTWGTDEAVQGTVVNTVRMYRPSGSNVNISSPSINNTATLQ